MDILSTITKPVFEQHVPVAKMPERNSSVYERLTTIIPEAYRRLIYEVVSPTHEPVLDADDELKALCVRLVCIEAFLRTCRSLDLVLTATGFGIVSTESTAPASSARVSALVEEMSVEHILTTDNIVRKMILVDGWGDTQQAAGCIPTLFYTPYLLKRMTTWVLSRQNWQTAKARAIQADVLLRNEISDEYMEELLHGLRHNSLGNGDHIIVETCLRFMGDYISQPETPVPNRKLLDMAVNQLETYPQAYSTYTHSRLYASRHAERFQNRREDSTFFFM